jgi:UrcA family protein
MSKHLIKLLPVVAALAISGLAQASRATDIPRVVVKYGDLNLNSKAGVAKLHARIHRAADTVCTPLESRVLGLLSQHKACVNEAVAQSVAAVNNPQLSNYHRYGAKSTVIARN